MYSGEGSLFVDDTILGCDDYVQYMWGQRCRVTNITSQPLSHSQKTGHDTHSHTSLISQRPPVVNIDHREQPSTEPHVPPIPPTLTLLNQLCLRNVPGHFVA